MAPNLAGFIVMCISRYLTKKGPTKAHIRAREQSRLDAIAARKRGEMQNMRERIAKLEKELTGRMPPDD